MKRFVLAVTVFASTTAVVLGLHHRAARANAVPATYSRHMEMTMHEPQRPGDAARAAAILAAARQVMAAYPTVASAEAAGYEKFLPSVPLPIEHYTNRANAIRSAFGPFDPLRPTSLIFARQNGTLRLVG